MATVARAHDPLSGVTGRWGPWLQALFWLVCLICVAGYPFVFSDGASTTVAFYTLVFAATGVAWNLFSGFTGYIALGHAVFFGVGQYALAIILMRLKIPGGYLPFEYVPLAGVIAAVFAVPLGLIALRTRRHTFIVITIAFLFIFQLLAENNVFGLTKGQAGLEYPIPLAWHGASYNIPFYYAIVVILIVVVAVAWLVRHSKYGLELLAIRDDEDRALGLGVRTMLLKVSAFTLSAFFVGMAGAVYGYFQLSVYPAAGQATGFSPLFDVLVALMAFLGGLGTISGPLLGALLIEPAYLQLNVYFGDTGWNLVLYGAGFLAVILLLPQGIVPAISTLIRNWRSAASGAQLASGPPQAPAGAPLPPPPAGGPDAGGTTVAERR